jgi:hypothetical protein
MTPTESDDDPDQSMAEAGEADGARRRDAAPVNDTEERYGTDESPT